MPRVAGFTPLEPVLASTPGTLGSTRLQAGFTLLELVLVLTIVALATVLLAPALGDRQARNFNTGVREAITLLNHARRTAVVAGYSTTAVFHTDADEPEAQGAEPELDGPMVWRSEGITVRYEDGAGQEVDVEEKVEISYYPEGGSSGGALILVGEDREVRLLIDPFSGRVTTEDE